MDYFTAKTFNLPELKGISAKNIEEHLKLYAGYVKFANYIQNQIAELSKDSEKWAYELAELQRRFAFEHNGMRNHEAYFSQFEGGPSVIGKEGRLMQQIQKDFITFDTFMERIKAVAMTRGVGWMMLYYCNETGHLLTQWVDEQHLGLLNGPKLILALDMWEHAFVYDYPTSEKKKYVDAFFENLSWAKVEERFER
ncbi:MAG: superoxide dismutase [Candidatus Pacebacteria bacterium]|nr:superoxide dismutase [Candidatus Paceibacterota bacterium]